MKLLFVIPWSKTLFGDEKAIPGHPHMGIAYLIAVLKQNGISDIEIFDQGLENNDAILFGKLEKFKPDLVGVTTFSYCYDYASNLISQIKKRTKTPLIIGGSHVSAIKKDILDSSQADFAMKGESEKSFLDFLKEFSGGRSYSAVGNLIWRDKAGNICENKAEPFIADPSAIPFPAYEAFQFSRYNYFATKTLPIVTSRGCPYGCNFCSVKLSMGRRFRPRSPDNVIAEMKHWIKTFGIKKFEINDDCFNIDLERAEKICDLIIGENLGVKYELYNGMRADRVTERLLQKMKDSGCIFISYGCESGNQGVINNMGKALKIEKVREAVELTNKVGIRNSINFIIGNKGETYASAMESIALAQALPTNFVNFYNIIPYPGTELFDWATKHAAHMIPVNEYLGKVGSRDLTPVFDTEEFPAVQRAKALKKGYALYEKTVLQFRLGKIAGYLAYIISRNRKLFSIGRKLALSNKIGFYIYSLLSYRSRKS